MILFYGSEICIDCRNTLAILKARNLEDKFRFIDMTANTDNMKDFLTLRDREAAFAPAREGANGRSFIGLCPIASISIGHGIVVTRMPDGSRQENTLEAEGGMAPALNHFLSHFQVTGEGSRYCGLYG